MSQAPSTSAIPSVASLVLPMDAPPVHIDSEADPATLAARLDHTEATWSQLGDEDPHWSVISDERFRRDRVDAHPELFYDSGHGDAEVFLAFLRRNSIDPAGLHRVLEFGCASGDMLELVNRAFPGASLLRFIIRLQSATVSRSRPGGP